MLPKALKERYGIEVSESLIRKERMEVFDELEEKVKV